MMDVVQEIMMHTPCGTTTGHGELCASGRECGNCTLKIKAIAEIESLRAKLSEQAKQEPVEKLWLWKNGDHYLAYEHEYPCYEQGGDPLTVGEPIGYALLKPSFGRESMAPTPPTQDKLIAELIWLS